MVFGPFIESWEWLKAHNPGSPFKKRHLSFLHIHYMYLISWAIVGSVMLYAAGGLAYIDALYFSSGAATQSGLNPVNVNDLNTFQQIVLFFIPMFATPIFINTFVVFVRLYWFERRFQHVVKEARNIRRTRTRSRTKTEVIGDKDLDRVERGVNGRSIVVLHDGKKIPNGDLNAMLESEKLDSAEGRESGSQETSTESQRESDESTNRDGELLSPQPSSQQTPTFHRDIVFADEVESEGDIDLPIQGQPQQPSEEQHIAFLENQRRPKDKGTLRIPGPRDFDRGHVPETLDQEIDDGQLSPQVTSPIEPIWHPHGPLDKLTPFSSNDLQRKRSITIDQPEHPRRLTFMTAGTTDHGKATPIFQKAPSSARPRAGTTGSFRQSGSREKEAMPYLSWQPTIGRNSAFVDLTEEQREELGGIEYRSLKTLAIVLVLYYFLWHLFGLITFLPWILRTPTWGSIVDNDGQSRVWWGIFTSASMFNDLGFTLTPDSMSSFDKAVFPLLIGTFLIVIGNTGFPCMLRLIIWITHLVVPRESGVWEELKFLLDHPRRCFTLMFPGIATWWLFWILVILNGVDLVFYIILDLNDPTVTTVGSSGYRVLDGLFQAASTRTAGFSVVNIANLHPAIQVSYLIMMYISVFPIAISVRRTNVYEEKSLGIYGSKMDEDEDEKEPSYVGAHLRRQLSFDLWYIFLGLFVIAIAEGYRIQNSNDSAFTMFACLFEIVSAYGTVGLSLGYPNIDASFSAEFSVISKLVIIAMQVRGRHRGLPYELDRAILLPSESLHRKEDADAARRMQRRNSTASVLETDNQGILKPATRSIASGREQEGSQGTTAETTRTLHARSGIGKMMAGLASVHDRASTAKESDISN